MASSSYSESGIPYDAPTGGAASNESELPSWLSGDSAPYVEALFEDYVTGAGAVPQQWHEIFDAWLGRPRSTPAPTPHVANGQTHAVVAESVAPQATPATGIFGLVDAYRSHGHLIADLDPLSSPAREHPLLQPEIYGLEGAALDRPGSCGNYQGLRHGTPRQLIESLRSTYSGTFAVEFMEIRNKECRDWLIDQMEPCHNQPRIAQQERVEVLREILRAERFEQFLHRRFVGQKRFSLEGAEALIPMLREMMHESGALDVSELVLGMAHRGRLNVLTNILGMRYESIFAEFQKGLIPSDIQGSGDVKYHRGWSSDHVTRSGRALHTSMCPNPSHLECVNPVVEGMVSAKQHLRGDTEGSQVIPVLIHGDAAFTGQGIVAETLALSELAHYRTGGTLHIIVNNQIGFTTDPCDYRFTKYPSDMAKVIQAPVFHVNADDPEACVHAAKLAVRFRQRFKEDVIIDLMCYRRHGHNEGDDPTFTQPVMYSKIRALATIGTSYAKRLVEQNVLDATRLSTIETEVNGVLEQSLETARAGMPILGSAKSQSYGGLWEGRRDTTGACKPTAISHDEITLIGRAHRELPTTFHPHPKVLRVIEQRAHALLEAGPIDWGTAEAAAFGSLLREGFTVRLSGQDVERGTFVHRHAVLYDVENGQKYAPLSAVATNGARLDIGNSLLSEAAALGFEYGYSCVDPNRLVIWEAQFGDFANGAQIIIDQFISSAEQKWNRASGLVMLLPHGYEGQGPEHSSARLERFLQLCAQDNLRVMNMTTPAQLFHALRRQIHAVARRPLIVMSPKSLLRNPLAVSRLEELETGQLHEVLDDPAYAASAVASRPVRRVLLCSGKIAYGLFEARKEHAFDDVAILRLEQLHPFPQALLRELLGKYATKDFVWVQEEPWNMGAWHYVHERLSDVLPRGAKLRYVGRPEAASPATGSYRAHEQEEMELIRESFAPRPRQRKSANGSE